MYQAEFSKGSPMNNTGHSLHTTLFIRCFVRTTFQSRSTLRTWNVSKQSEPQYLAFPAFRALRHPAGYLLRRLGQLLPIRCSLTIQHRFSCPAGQHFSKKFSTASSSCKCNRRPSIHNFPRAAGPTRTAQLIGTFRHYNPRRGQPRYQLELHQPASMVTRFLAKPRHPQCLAQSDRLLQVLKQVETLQSQWLNELNY
jgi:hypothetical protein